MFPINIIYSLAQVFTVNDKSELETVVVSPVVEVYHYSSNENMSSSHKKCLDKLDEIKRQVLYCTASLDSILF